ncbi:MAG: CoA transferase [Bryobacteraceae bacterium]|nr:CoA transferase [Bryobacteraceae bacterium]MDW8378976.1 CoA transferase [Bryobacterales bacterium]
MLAIEALQGIRVLDLTRLLPGPLATQWMVQMGAEVIKIEEPGQGDPMRHMRPEGLFELVNRGKKSVVLNLKLASDQQRFHQLAASADLVVEGFRPGVMDRLNCGWQALHRQNPQLIYVAVTGYGSQGAFRDLAGHDVNYLAMAGVLDLIGEPEGPPTIPGIQIADIAGGSMQALIGALAALLKRRQTGCGQYVEINMMRGAASFLAVARAQLEGGAVPRRGQEVLSGRYACYHIYATADQRYIAVGALEAKFWRNLCEALGRPEYAAHQFAEDPQRSEIISVFQAIFRQRSAAEWWDMLKERDVCVTPVRTVAEAMADISFDFPGKVPALGEHTEEYLSR